MLTIQRTESLRRKEGCNSPGTHLLPPVAPGGASGWKPAERSVSFNRDVHVKRIGESRQYHTIQTATYPAYVAERERSRRMALLDSSDVTHHFLTTFLITYTSKIFKSVRSENLNLFKYSKIQIKFYKLPESFGRPFV